MINLQNVSKTYLVYPRPRHWLFEKLTGRVRHQKVEAVKDVSLAISPGECLGVIGVNGSGKSTLLRLLARISRPSAGTVEVRGRVSAILELDSGFHPEFTGRENVRVGLAILGITGDEAARREREVIEFSELGRFIDMPVRAYSSGMYLRLGFSLATSVRPDALLVDEALAVGDEWFRGKCIERIRRVRESGATIVIVSHDLTMVRALCGRAVLMHRGEKTADGEPASVINHYLDAVYAGAVEEAGAGAHPRRRGIGEAEIGEVRLLDKDGGRTALLKTGEPFAIEFEYRAKASIPEPLFGVNIFRSDGVLAVSTNNEAAKAAGPWFAGAGGDRPPLIEPGRRGVARFAVEACPLLPGDYDLSVNIFRGKSGAHSLVEEALSALSFKVVSGHIVDRGLCVMPARWTIS